MHSSKKLKVAFQIAKKRLLSDNITGFEIDKLSEKLSNQMEVYWPKNDVNSKIFKARFPDEKMLLQMASATTKDLICFWHPWHMEKTFKPEYIGKKIKWFNVPNGDEEWAHSLVRFTHMLDIAAAYKITGDSLFINTYISHIESFMSARYNDKEPLWANRLDAAIRLINLIRSYDLVKQSPEISSCIRIFIYSLMLTDAELLHKGLGQRAGNWEFFITTSLLVASIFLSENFSVSQWQNNAQRRLSEIIDSEILPDGNLIEEVPMYHGQCVITLLDYLVILKSNSFEFEPKVVCAVANMTKNLINLADPQGLIPQIGDSDAFDVYYISNFAKAVLGVDLNDNQTNNNRTITSNLGKVIQSTTVFKSVGWTIARWPLSNKGTGYLLFDASGSPPIHQKGHSHADDLQFIFHTSEGPVLIDPGRFTYTHYFGAPLHILGRTIFPYGRLGFLYTIFYQKFKKLNRRNWRKFFRNTLSHNTVSCDGKNQRGYDNPKETLADVQLQKVLSEGPLFLFRGAINPDIKKPKNLQNTTNAISIENSKYCHSRTLAGYLPNLLIIVDSLVSKSKHNWISSYHFGKDIKAQYHDKSVFFETKNGKKYIMQFASLNHLDLNIEVEDDWLSPEYNKKFLSQTARVKIKNTSKAKLITVIMLEPLTNKASETNLTIKKITTNTSSEEQVFMASLKSLDVEINVYINDTDHQFCYNNIRSDAFFSINHIINNKLSEIGFVDGSFIEQDGIRYYSKNGRCCKFIKICN